MRAVDKGAIPVDEHGVEIRFAEYARARRYLIDRLGEYCSYCERYVPANLAVEHVLPKAHHPELELSWDNFLLSCTNCNSTKGDRPIRLDAFVWPHIDATSSYFSYPVSGLVEANSMIDDRLLLKRINDTIALLGLDKKAPRPGTVAWEVASDRRVEHRIRALQQSDRFLEVYQMADSAYRDTIRELIEVVVKQEGLWSIWMRAFQDFPEVVDMLFQLLPGTRRDDSSL